MKIIYCFVFCFMSTLSFGQLDKGKLYLGIKGGIIASEITNLRPMIVPPFYDQIGGFTTNEFLLGKFFNSDFDKNGEKQIIGGVQARFNFTDFSGIFLEFNFAQRNGRFGYEDDIGLEYDIFFKHDYFEVAIAPKLHPIAVFVPDSPWSRILHFNAGFNFSMINKDEIIYNCNDDNPNVCALEDQNLVQRNLQNTINGRFNAGFIFGFGFEVNLGDDEFKHIVNVDCRWLKGFSNVLDVSNNNFLIEEVDNKLNSFEITLGYLFLAPLDY